MKQQYFLFLLVAGTLSAQSGWPSSSWTSAANLTSVMSASGVIELSGLHWNPDNNRLYAVQNDGHLRVLQYEATSGSFSQIGNKSISGGPEGITQANLSANEFYTIDENNYEIRKYTHNDSFSTVTESHHWDLLASPSPMTDTGNTGPEGIVFIPDEALAAAGFTSSVSGLPYTSVNGMGGLIFVAHQSGGYIWVFDVNPDVDDAFAFVGKYRTNRSESCDLAFDRSTNLLYILHNVGANYLEVTDLSLATGPEVRFTTTAEYFIANPPGSNTNVEGFAISPNCPDGGFAWLCRDASSGEALSIRQDVLRGFDIGTTGGCDLGLADMRELQMVVFPNPAESEISILFGDTESRDMEISVRNVLGKEILSRRHVSGSIDVGGLAKGLYFVQVTAGGKSFRSGFLKK